jgi:hypothetical protein
MKKALGKNIHFFGRWQAKGYIGYAAPLKNFQEKIRKQEWQNPGKALYFFPYSVKPISEEKKRELYLRYKIGFNMHYYNQRDIGNSRMYETALFGMMQLCDKAAKGMHEHIFKPDVEIVYYDNIKDAIDKAKFYLKHDNLREKIAKAGFERAIHEYNPNKCFIDLLYWAVNVPRKSKVIEF